MSLVSSSSSLLLSLHRTCQKQQASSVSADLRKGLKLSPNSFITNIRPEVSEIQAVPLKKFDTHMSILQNEAEIKDSFVCFEELLGDIL